MISTGNDIVSLSAIDITRTKLPAFYSKILSTPESTLYKETVAATLPFENFVWLLWSIKESAYKYLKRMNPALLFTPVKLVVEQLQVPASHKISDFGPNDITGAGFINKPAFNAEVSFGSDKLYARSLVYNDLICTVVHSNENFEHTHWGIKWIDDPHHDSQSAAVRDFLLENLQKLSVADNVSIRKNEHGIPVLLNGTEEMSIPVSLSHHEHYVGYSFQYF
jgi:phosphopantetheinyl transferase (holo-ACP synthase)